MGFDFDGKGQR